MLVLVYIILLILVVSILFIWGRKISWLSSKITFIGLLVFLAITGLLLINVIYKVSNSSKTAKKINNLQQERDYQEYLAQDTANYKNKIKLIVGTTSNFYPWVYKNKKTMAGFNIDLVKQAVSLMAKKIEFKTYPNKEALFNALENKEIDIIADLSPVSNSNESYAYSLKITNPPLIFIGKKNITKSLANNKDLQVLSDAMQNKTVAVPNAPFFKKDVSNVIGSSNSNNIIILNNPDEVIKNVENGKYQIGLTEYFSFVQYLKNHPKSNLGAFYPLLNSNLNEGFAFVVNSKDIELKKQLDIALSLLKRRGSISNLSIKYFKEDITL